MYKMSELNRSPAKFKKILVEQDDNSKYTTQDCSIIIPKKFLNTRLTSIADRYFTVAICMVISGKDYTVWSVPAVIELGLAEYESVLVDNVECVEFKYEAGDVVVVNDNAPIDNTLPYYLTTEITRKGTVVPYLAYDDFVRLPEKFPKYCGLGIPDWQYAIIYMSYICRDPKDLKRKANLTKDNSYTNIPLADTHLAVQNPLNKFSGGYLDEAIPSALISKSEKSSSIESVLRS